MIATAVGWTAASTVALFLMLAVADYLIRWHDPGMRVIWSLLALLAVGWSVYRFFSLPLSCRLDNLDVAQRIERRFPQLGDRLSNAVEFLSQKEDQPHAGSAALRRAVVARATSEVEGLNLTDAINRHPLARAALAAGVACSMVAVLALLDGSAVSTSLARLANPLGEHDWPRTTVLQVVDPPRLDSLEITLHPPAYTADAPPTVSIEKPAADLFVTPVARVPLRILVKDDLAIRNIEMLVRRSDRPDASDDANQTVPLWTGPEKVNVFAESRPDDPSAMGDSRLVQQTWDLSPLALRSGTTLDLQVRASDYLPQWGQSPVPRRIQIISSADLENRTVERQAVILSKLSNVLELQHQARSQTGALQIQLRGAEQFENQHVNSLRVAEMNQRQVARMLTDPSAGIPGEIDRLFSQLEVNRLDRPETAPWMDDLRRQIEQLDNSALPAIRRNITAAIKTAHGELNNGSSETPIHSTQQSLAQAGEHQDRVIAVLKKQLEDLSHWTGFATIVREISQLLRQQQDAEQKTKQLALRTIGRRRGDLNDQQQADLHKIADRQIRLTRRFEAVEQTMSEMSRQLSGAELLPAATLSDATELARRLAIGSQMREATQRVEANQMARAAELQKKIISSLQQVLDMLSDRREHESNLLVQKLREAQDTRRLHHRSTDHLLTDLAEDDKADTQDSRQAAANSTDSTANVREGKVNMNQMRRLMDQIWGELPARMRQAVSQGWDEEFLLKYELELEQYYRRLAEDPEPAF